MVIFITGGARSGKSSYGENLIKDKSDVTYIATAKIYDDEMADRVKKHREMRPSEWKLYEGHRDLTKAVDENNYYFLDCLTNLSSNIMFEHSKGLEKISPKLQKEIESDILKEVKSLINKINNEDRNLIIITNELGSSIVPEHHISRVFRDIQGRVNQEIGKLCDEAYLIVSGFEVKLKWNI